LFLILDLTHNSAKTFLRSESRKRNDHVLQCMSFTSFPSMVLLFTNSAFSATRSLSIKPPTKVISASFLLKLNCVGHGISSLVAAYLPFERLGQIIFTRILLYYSSAEQPGSRTPPYSLFNMRLWMHVDIGMTILLLFLCHFVRTVGAAVLFDWMK
jgi:hypothetical protein